MPYRCMKSFFSSLFLKRFFSKISLVLSPIIYCGFLFLSALGGVEDLSAAVPSPQVKPYQRPLIILDPGHGGDDHGAKVYFLKEKHLTLRTAILLKKKLESLGYRVMLTRSRDVFITLSRRAVLANRSQAKIFVSLHYNSCPSKEVKGVEVFYYGSAKPERLKDSQLLASHVLENLVAEVEAPSRGVKKGNFHVIRETTMPAILVEAAFLTNKEERSLLRTPLYLEKIATGIATGIDRYMQVSK